MTQKEPIEFQIYDWQEDHENNDEDDEDDDDEDEKNNGIGSYIIHTFGGGY